MWKVRNNHDNISFFKYLFKELLVRYNFYDIFFIGFKVGQTALSDLVPNRNKNLYLYIYFFVII